MLVIVAALAVCAGAWWRWGRSPAVTGPDGREELCCRCNARIVGDEIHEIIAVPTDDRAIGVEIGGTYVAADFCADCCLGPGEGCTHPSHGRLVA